LNCGPVRWPGESSAIGGVVRAPTVKSVHGKSVCHESSSPLPFVQRATQEQTGAPGCRELGFPVSQIGGRARLPGRNCRVGRLSTIAPPVRPARIAQGLSKGSLHAGVTGEDLAARLALGRRKHTTSGFCPASFGFGGADVIVAVGRRPWLDVDTTQLADLEAAGAAFSQVQPHGAYG